MTDLHDLEIIMSSRVPLVVLETYEEPRALQLVTRAGISQNRNVYAWTITDGLRRLEFKQSFEPGATHEPKDVLRHIKESSSPGIFALCDFHPFLGDDPVIVRMLKDIAIAHDTNQHTIVFISHEFSVPVELQRYTSQMSLTLPSDEQLLSIVREEALHWANANNGKRVKTDSKTLDQLIANLRGLSFADARRLVRGAIVDDGAITDSDLPQLNRAKFKLMALDEVLSFEFDTASFAEVAGLDNLKNWLEQRRESFISGGDGQLQDAPKGIMLLGVQGSGKSLAAKAVAGCWRVPLLRLDFAALYNKYIGETEKNLRDSLELADTMSPCVLWLDEIEKGLGGDDSDHGTSRRLLGTLLTWMSERKARVFMVATSNDISRLPPELVRKGRLDEIFFVDLPDRQTRETIFEIHLGKRFQDPERFDLPRLAEASEGFSGAEIESAIVAGLYSSSAGDAELSTDVLLNEIAGTSPLSVVMAEKIAALRVWAQGRTVPAQ